MGRLIDTSELIHIERTLRGAAAKSDALRDLASGSFIAAIQVMELAVGAYLADTPRRVEERDRFLNEVLLLTTLIPFAEREARETARLHAMLRRAGTPIADHDLQIAATALVHGHEVMTRNVRDFEKVPGLRVVDSAQL